MSAARARRWLRPVPRRDLSSLVALSAVAALFTGCRDHEGGGGRVRREELYGLRALPTYEIELGAARASLSAAPREWVEATFRGSGETLSQVGVRLKGHRSMRGLAGKPSFKIKVDRYRKGRRFLGLRELTLNAMVDDPTMMREALGYRLYREVGVPAPETGYVQLRVDGAPYGVYLLVETVDQEFVEDRFGDSRGEIFEGSSGCDLYPDDVAGLDQDLGEDGPGGRVALAALAAAAGTSPPAELMTGQRARFDASALSYLAVSAVLGDFDGYRHAHNYHLFHRPEPDRWFFIPWGIDRTFFKRLGPFDSNGLLAARCFADHACRLAYLHELRRVLDHLDRLHLDQGADVIAAFLAPAVAADQRRPYQDDRMAAARADLRRFVRTRAADFAGALSCLGGDREVDRDGDGHGCMDCDDRDPAVHPGAAETCGNRRDDDCSGQVDDAPACPCPTVIAEGATFSLCDRPMRWADAAAHCAAAGASLARLESAAQSAQVFQAARAIDPRARWWIGLSDAAQEGRFVWVDGAPVDLTGWARGQPDNGSCNQDCAALLRNGSGRWQDRHCGQHQPFVCRMGP